MMQGFGEHAEKGPGRGNLIININVMHILLNIMKIQ